MNKTACYWPGCTKPRSKECGFCTEHTIEMRTPKMEARQPPQPTYTVCECGAPANDTGLCETCEPIARRRLFR